MALLLAFFEHVIKLLGIYFLFSVTAQRSYRLGSRKPKNNHRSDFKEIAFDENGRTQLTKVEDKEALWSFRIIEEARGTFFFRINSDWAPNVKTGRWSCKSLLARFVSAIDVWLLLEDPSIAFKTFLCEGPTFLSGLILKPRPLCFIAYLFVHKTGTIRNISFASNRKFTRPYRIRTWTWADVTDGIYFSPNPLPVHVFFFLSPHKAWRVYRNVQYVCGVTRIA